MIDLSLLKKGEAHGTSISVSATLLIVILTDLQTDFPFPRYLIDDISLIFCKMGIVHGTLLLGVMLVVVPTLPEILSCPLVMLNGAL